MNLTLVVPVVLATLLNAVANTVWKIYFQKGEFSYTSFSSVLSLFNIYIISGILCYVGSMLLFFYMLSKFDLSVIIPLTALTYIFNMMADLNEQRKTTIIMATHDKKIYESTPKVFKIRDGSID